MVSDVVRVLQRAAPRIGTDAGLLMTGQYFYQPYVPKAFAEVKMQYLKDSADPLMSRVGSPQVAWFTSALILELVVQTPCFLIGIWGLYKDNVKVYPLLAVYGGLAASSTLFCLVQALADNSLTDANRLYIMQAYGPFTVVPTIVLVDMLIRCTALIGVAGQVKAKRQ